MKLLTLIMILCIQGCASAKTKQDIVMDCIDKYVTKDVKANEAYEMCRQMYRLKNIAESK